MFALLLSALLSFSGRAPSIAFDSHGRLHVIYVDDASRRVMHRVDDAVTAVSEGKADARGEIGPVLVEANGTLTVAYTSERNLFVQRSRDDGKTWSAPALVQDDHAGGSHSFIDATANRDGDVVVSWLDNRSGHQGVRAAVVRAAPQKNFSVDDFTCECCRTALLTKRNGDVVVAYRDHGADNLRNMAYAISRDGGATFTRRGDIADDQWHINGCPESGPSLVEANDGSVYTAWFNGRTSSIEFSTLTHAKPLVIATGPVNHPFLGLLPDGRVIVSYESNHDVVARIRDAHGKWGDPFVVAEGATYPRYARRGTRAFFAVVHDATIDVIEWKAK